jgi:hypothetical protein
LTTIDIAKAAIRSRPEIFLRIKARAKKEQTVKTRQRANAIREYATEDLLISRFLDTLRSNRSPWGAVSVLREFDYRTGRTDVLVLTEDNEIIAFEAKLSRWRAAVHQAFRSTFFAHRSFVVLPDYTAQVALAYDNEFDIRRVGLCTMVDDAFQVLLPAPRIDPINAWLSARAAGMILQANGYSTH